MKRRPLWVTVIGVVYVAAGALGLAYHLSDFRTGQPFQYDVAGIALVRFLAILAGVWMLRGKNWARWLAMAWIGFHVVLGALHSWGQFGMHAAICGVFAYGLFRPGSAGFFERVKEVSRGR